MSSTSEAVNNPAIDALVQSDEYNRLGWIPYEDIADVKSTQIDNVYCATAKEAEIMLLLLGSNEACTPTLVSELARIYSLPTGEYNNMDNNFRRYSIWRFYRNSLILGFTKSNDNNYYMVAYKRFYHCYSRYGFCSTCGILRCSPVWCVCGHKELSDGWTSNNKQLDEFIKKTQSQTNSANDAYLEWIPSDCIGGWEFEFLDVFGLPTLEYVESVPLEITDSTHDLYYDELCDKHPDILTAGVWHTIGFTYKASEQKYCLIKEVFNDGLCLACTRELFPTIKAFCKACKAPAPLDWTTGNRLLDLFIMESWSNTKNAYDMYIQWIEYSQLTEVVGLTPLRHGCTHMATWNELSVTLKEIADEQNNQPLDLHQLINEYPTILTPDNIWIIGFTRKTGKYYLVFYHRKDALLDRFIINNFWIERMQFSDFDELKEIGVGGYGTVYTANYKKYSEVEGMQQTVVLKRFKISDEMPDLFISEFRNRAKCSDYTCAFLNIHGVAQVRDLRLMTQEYWIVMQYANNGSLLSYLVQNINKLTWRDKLRHLKDIAYCLWCIHDAGLVHCDLHGGNLVIHDDTNYICDLGPSRSVNSHESNPTIQGVLPFIAPEVFRTCKFTQESDVYSFGIIVHLIATGEPPFRDRQFDRSLVRDIMGGLRPSMPDSAPREYKKLAERCCDADPDKRPDAFTLYRDIIDEENKSSDNEWNTIYHTDVGPLSRDEKEKYTSKPLPTGW